MSPPVRLSAGRSVCHNSLKVEVTLPCSYLQGFGSGRIRCYCLDLDPDLEFKFLCIWVRSQPPDRRAKIECRKGSKSYLFEENLKDKDRQKMKKATISIKNHHRNRWQRCLDPVNIHLNLKQDIFWQMYPCFYLFVDNKKFSFQRPICSLENLISLIPLRHYTTLLILQSAEIWCKT